MSLQAALIICLITIVTSVLGLFGLWQPVVLVISPFLLGVCVIKFNVHFFKDLFSRSNLNLFHALLFLLLIFTIVFHLIGVFMPETGFDALWYHLPLIREYVIHHALIYDYQYYQSLYPQYGDGLLLLGFGLFGVIGAKLMAFLFSALLFSSVYFGLRRNCGSGDSLAGGLIVVLFQVVSWQSSSAYVDVISAVFFLWSTQYFFTNDKDDTTRLHFLMATLASGIFFGTKFVNLGFLPLYFLLSLLYFISRGKIKQLFTYWLVITVTALPWYLRAWWFTGSLIYPIGTSYAVPVIAQMGVTGWREWLRIRVQHIWQLPADFFFHNDGYVTPLLLFFSPVIVIKKNWSKEVLSGLLIGVYGLFFWFFFPPPSTRYVLGPVIVLWIVVYQKIIHTFQYHKLWIGFIRVICILNILIFLLIRTFVTTRSVPYLLQWETQQQYLDRFRNGFLDEKIDHWYGTSDETKE